MRESILEKFADPSIRVSVVWIEMLPTDNREAAQKMADETADPRVRHYFDPRSTHLAGQALAEGIISEGRGPAWDVYLFYDRDAEWSAEPPAPIDWYHQLGGGQRADPARFACGVLDQRLHAAMHALTQTVCTHAAEGK